MAVRKFLSDRNQKATDTDKSGEENVSQENRADTNASDGLVRKRASEVMETESGRYRAFGRRRVEEQTECEHVDACCRLKLICCEFTYFYR